MGYRTTDFIITHLSSHQWHMALSNGVAGSIFGQIWSFFAVYACICYEYEEYWDADGWNMICRTSDSINTHHITSSQQ